jgi:hypothetical protein
MKMKLVWTMCLMAACLSAVTSRVSAAIIYVDATTSNTAHAPSAGGGAWNAAAVGDIAGDNIWRTRANFGLTPLATSVPPAGVISTTGGTIYESSGNNCCDDVPRIVTSATAPAGLKDVYVYFWTNEFGQGWRIRAGLTDTVDPLPLFVGGGALAGTPLPVDTGVRDGQSNGGRRLYQAYVGQTSATSLAVFVDDGPGASGAERTWYDGIGYEAAAVPEPATLALLGTCLVSLAFRRVN